MSNAKEASEAEHLGNKLLQLCRKKAPEKDLLQVLEVCVFKFFQMCARAMIALNVARLSFSLSLLGRLASKSDDTTRFLFLYVYYLSADPISLSLLFHKTLAFDAQIARNQPVGRWRPNAEARVGADARARVEAPIEGDHRARFVVDVGSVSDFRSGTTVRERGDFADGVREF